jgi:hypothetical protein
MVRGRIQVDEFGLIVIQAAYSLPLAIILSWIGQAVAQLVGIRRISDSDTSQLIDYIERAGDH